MGSNSIIPPVSATGAKSPGQTAQVVPVQSLPDGLKSVSKAMILEGEVVRQNDDGSTRVRTAEGTIDLNLRGRQPQPGARLEITVPTGAPPEQVTVRPLPPQQQQQPPAPFPPQTVPASPPTGQQTAPATPVTPPPQITPPAQTIPASQTPAQNSTAPLQEGGIAKPPAAAPVAAPPPSGTHAEALSRPLPLPFTQPLAQTYQPPVSGAVSPQTTPLQIGQNVRLAPFPPAQAQLAVQQAAIAAQTDVSFTGLTKLAFQSGIPVVGNGDTRKAVLTASGTLASQNVLFPLLGKNTLPPVIQSLLPATGNMPPKDIKGISSAPSAIPNFMNAGIPGDTALANTAYPSGIIAGNTQSPPRLFQLDAKIISFQSFETRLMPTISQAIPSAQTAAPIGMQAQITPPLLASDSRPFLLTAVVTGFTPQNLPLVSVQWPDGTFTQNFVLQFPADNLKTGMLISLQPSDQASPIQTQTAGAVPGARTTWPLMSGSPLWPVMDEMMQGLSQSSPQLSQMLARILPSPSSPNQMGPAVMLFAAALRTGDISAWLGEKKIDALMKIGKSATLSRLGQDIGNAAKSVADTQGDWKSYPIPMLWQNEISKVMLHVHHDNTGADKESKDGSTRFVMDLSLTRMGEVQLDGLVRGARLDLIVRTELPISASMQDAMRKAYADAMDGSQTFGDIGFQSDIKGWAHIMKREDMLTASA